MRIKMYCLTATLLLIQIFLFAGCKTSDKAILVAKPSTEKVRMESNAQESWETISNRWGSVPIKKIENVAKDGEVSAQYYLGCAYEDGNGVTKDTVASFKWVKLAANQGLVVAQDALGSKYYSGTGVAQNYLEAAKYFRLAAENGNAIAQACIGYLYREGLGVPKDLNESVKWYRKAAGQGVAEAQRNLGYAYQTGRGVSKDYMEAARLYRLAAVQGDAVAQCDLGHLYYYGLGLQINWGEAVKWYRKSAEQGESAGQYALGWMYEHGLGVETNYVEAAKFIRLAAEQGDSAAQANLGWLYGKGLGVPQDFGEGLKWCQKSAQQGNADAQKNLPWLQSELSLRTFDVQYQNARRYLKGDGVPKNTEEAFKWMQKAATSDALSSRVGDAMYYLGLMYEKGEGVQTNLLEARNWLVKASILLNLDGSINSLEGGQPDACFRVGEWYENGDAVPQDDYRAVKYYYNAVRNFNGRRYKSEAAEQLLKLYAEGRGLTKTNQEPEDFIDRGLANKKSVIELFENLLTTPQAELYVGEIYNQGTLVSQNLVEAAARFQLAIDEDSLETRKMLDEIELKMSVAQKEAAKKRLEYIKRDFEMEKSIQQKMINLYDL